MSTVKRKGFLEGDRSYLSLKAPENKRFFLIVEDGRFYRIENKSRVITQLSRFGFLQFCIGIARGVYKVEGTGQYGSSLFKNNEKKEVI